MLSLIFHSFEIIGTLGFFTLGGAAVLGTLGVDNMIVTLEGAIDGTYLGFTFVWVYLVSYC